MIGYYFDSHGSCAEPGAALTVCCGCLQSSPPLDAVSSPSPELEVLSAEHTDSNRRLDSAVLAVQVPAALNSDDDYLAMIVSNTAYLET